MVTLHEVITFLVSMQISISSLQTHNVNRCGRSRHLARKLSLMTKRSSPNLFVFFFQAEDGRRVGHVTGGQTCALPISLSTPAQPLGQEPTAIKTTFRGVTDN